MHIPWEHIDWIQFKMKLDLCAWIWKLTEILWKSRCKPYNSSPSHYCNSINEILLFTFHMFPADFLGQPNRTFMVYIMTARAGICFFFSSNFRQGLVWKFEATCWHSVKLQKLKYSFSLNIVSLNTFRRKLCLLFTG